MNLTGKVLVGDNRQTLKKIASQSVQTVVTSPPYWGLRDYGTATWIGGDENCSHRRESKQSDKTITGHKNFTEMLGVSDAIYKQQCPRCGAVREDEQIGLEPTPAEYVEELCQVFDEVWRILKDDGTLWVNIGDSYASYRDGKATPDTTRGDSTGTLVPKGSAANRMASSFASSPIKHKDLVGIPWRVAFALQERGWYLRQDIIWAKPNPMPESVTDRCTKSHEYIFLLTKNPHYYFDNDAIREPLADVTIQRDKYTREVKEGNKSRVSGIYAVDHTRDSKSNPDGRNKRSVWNIAVKPYKEAHFATYPAELIMPCVLAGSKEGDIVLDPFSGSGTTGEVALQLGRNYLGCELNPEYAKLSEKRLTNAVGMFGEVIIEREENDSSN